MYVQVYVTACAFEQNNATGYGAGVASVNNGKVSKQLKQLTLLMQHLAAGACSYITADAHAAVAHTTSPAATSLATWQTVSVR